MSSDTFVTYLSGCSHQDLGPWCCFPWSTGQVEGQVQRLKVVKRGMYGRATCDLLRKRVLHAA